MSAEDNPEITIYVSPEELALVTAVALYTGCESPEAFTRDVAVLAGKVIRAQVGGEQALLDAIAARSQAAAEEAASRRPDTDQP